MQLETKRLFLRHPEPADAESYTAIHNSEFVLRYNAMQPTTEAWMAGRFADEEYLENTVFLEEKETGKLIGAIFLEDDDLRYGVVSKSLSYFLAEEKARKGYMKEAMQAVLKYLFQEEKLECICCRAFAPNTASRRLLESLGFRQDGTVRRCVRGWGDTVFDDCLYSLLREEFL